MADNLPLIPNKQSLCADVRPVLREVFRELESLPPLSSPPGKKHVEDKHETLPQPNIWVDDYSSERREIWQREEELKQEYAKRLSCNPLPNIYKLHSPARMNNPVTLWKEERGILLKKDLKPTVIQDCEGDDKLWVRNILNGSSCDLSSRTVDTTLILSPVPRSSLNENTLQSVSIGDVVQRTCPPPPLELGVVTPQPEHVVCVPPKLDFINFTVGRVYTQNIRLMNVSKSEIRLSVRPPHSTDLLLQVMSSPGMRVTSGASTWLQVQFSPRDVRTQHDCLRVRVSIGGELHVPIACYMEPPLLHILAPSIPSSLSCTPEDSETWPAVCGDCDLLDLGAKLLGEEHRVPLVFHCTSEHASFFLLTEEDWLSRTINSVTADGAVVSGTLSVTPAWWQGGGAVRAQCRCRALSPSLQLAQFRLVCSTGVTRSLHLLADAVLHRPKHLTLHAHEKDYDICSEDDPACEYFVHLGTAFPGRALSTNVDLLNHSPVAYTYYWKMRRWGVCSCAEQVDKIEESCESEDNSFQLCIGALETRIQRKQDQDIKKGDEANFVCVEPAVGEIAPRSSNTLRIHAPDVGSNPGVHRAVLMFILNNIPKESLPSDYDPMIVSSRSMVESESLPGFQGCAREVCDLVCFQLEVWWEVVPLCFVLNPPVLPLVHSQRVQQLEVLIDGVQLFGPESIRGLLSVPDHILSAPSPEPVDLTITRSVPFRIQVQLPASLNHCLQQDVITLMASNDYWTSRCTVTRQCTMRNAVVRPAITWLGVVLPGTHMNATIGIINDTYQQLEWRGECIRWVGARPPCGSCDPLCQHSACSCELLRPARGLLSHGDRDAIHYCTKAPQREGPLVTLVKSSGCGATCCALVASRALTPRLVLRVLSCNGDKTLHCGGCLLDEGDNNSARGSSTLRPRVALTLARRSCYSLRVSNLTPIPTALRWDLPPEGDDILKVIFIPNAIDVAGHAHVDIKVVLQGRRVCARRVFLRRALVTGADKPLYLVIDTAIAGLEIVCEVPLGGGIETDSFITLRKTEMGKCPRDVNSSDPSTPDEIFTEYDRIQRLQKEKKCTCSHKMIYIPPPEKKPHPPYENFDDIPSIEIVREPVQLRRVCECSAATDPILPELSSPCCLQFINLPLRTVRSRTLVIRNESVVSARWFATLRHYQRRRRRTLRADKWAEDVAPPGLVVECAPPGGVLGPRGQFHLHVSVYADCWGLYRDQLLIQVERLDPVIVELWVEAEGPPLQFALKPNDTYVESDPVLWLSASDPQRKLQAKNTSRSELIVYAYVLTEHEHDQDVLPLRLYLRLFDVSPRTCPCVTAFNSESNGEVITVEEEMETGVELYLAPDHGTQSNNHFNIHPQVLYVPSGGRAVWTVTLQPTQRYEVAPPSKLLFTITPVHRSGRNWYRPDPQSETVLLRQTVREGMLDISCKEVRVKMCALDLPHGDVMRVRKRFEIRNVGNGPLELDARTSAPWTIVKRLHHQDCMIHETMGCACKKNIINGERVDHVTLYLEPRSSTQMCVELSLKAGDITVERIQCAQSVQTTPLLVYDADNVLLNIPLVVELEFPILCVHPSEIDFGYVTEGDTRKTYFTVSHSSPSETVTVVTMCAGGAEYRVWPPTLLLRPRGSARLYVQYTARWCGGGTAECIVHVTCVRGAAGAGALWGSGAQARCSATPARDHRFTEAVHDHTDDTHLLPPNLTY